MIETSVHLLDRVIPDVPVRQWVLSFPWPLRRLVKDGLLVPDPEQPWLDLTETDTLNAAATRYLPRTNLVLAESAFGKHGVS